MVETLTPEMIDQMPAGPEMNALIEAEIFNAIPLTDEEWDFFRATVMMDHGRYFAPNSARPLRVPLVEPEYNTRLMFRLQWPSDYSSDAFGSSKRLVDKMRADGWRFSMEDEPYSNNVVSVTFFRPGPETWPVPKGWIQAVALGDTDAIAICRAALKAKRQERLLTKEVKSNER